MFHAQQDYRTSDVEHAIAGLVKRQLSFANLFIGFGFLPSRDNPSLGIAESLLNAAKRLDPTNAEVRRLEKEIAWIGTLPVQ